MSAQSKSTSDRSRAQGLGAKNPKGAKSSPPPGESPSKARAPHHGFASPVPVKLTLARQFLISIGWLRLFRAIAYETCVPPAGTISMTKT